MREVRGHCTWYFLEMARARPKTRQRSKAVESPGRFNDRFWLKTFGSIQKPVLFFFDVVVYFVIFGIILYISKFKFKCKIFHHKQKIPTKYCQKSRYTDNTENSISNLLGCLD